MVPVYANPSAHPRCLVYLLDKYFSKLPPRAIDMDVYYLHCVSKKPADGDSWYECSPVGKEKLQKFVELLCNDAGITDKKTNHSLRVTGATALFSAGVPKRLIHDMMGHQSNALHLYKCPSLAQ